MRTLTTCFETTSSRVTRILATKSSASLATGLAVLVIMPQTAMRTVMMTLMMHGLH